MALFCFPALLIFGEELLPGLGQGVTPIECPSTTIKAAAATATLLLHLLVQDPDGVFGEDVTCPAPHRRNSHHVPKHTRSAHGTPLTSQTGETYCRIDSADDISTGTTGAAVASPTSVSWSAVLYLLIVVGVTSAEGSEKSQ